LLSNLRLFFAEAEEEAVVGIAFAVIGDVEIV